METSDITGSQPASQSALVTGRCWPLGGEAIFSREEQTCYYNLVQGKMHALSHLLLTVPCELAAVLDPLYRRNN